MLTSHRQDLESFLAARSLARDAGSQRFNLRDFCFDEQYRFITDPAHFKTAVCSRRSGKTVACAAHLISAAISKPHHTCLYITLSRLNAKRIIWNELLSINGKYLLGGEPNETELSIRFQNGSVIYLSGAKDKTEIEKFRGLPLALVYIDEGQSFRTHIKDLIDDVIGPALIDYAGTLCLIGTPGPVPSGYFYDCSVKNPHWSKHGWTFWDNPHIAIKSGESHDTLLQRELTRRGVSIQDASIQREWFGKWVIDENALVFRYRKEINHYETLPLFQKKECVIGVDLGHDDADAISILTWNPHDQRVFLTHEDIQTKQGISELAEKLSNLIKLHDPLKIVMDTGGLGKKIAEELRKRFSLPITAAEKSRKFEYIELVNDALRTGKLLAKETSQFAQDCMVVEWDKDKETPDRKFISDRFHSDICDSVLYAYREALHWLSTPETPKVNLKNVDEKIAHFKKLLDEGLEKQILKQEQEEAESRFYETAGLGEQELLSYYVNRRR